MSTPRAFHTATLLQDGGVLVVGGTTTSHAVLATAERYDPISHSWSVMAPMQHHRTGHTATLLQDGTVLVVGGLETNTVPAAATNSVERFDPTSGAWKVVRPMRTKRARHTAVLLGDGTVLVSGGEASESAADAERYDPNTDQWTNAGVPSFSRFGGTATLLADGTVLIAGGWGWMGYYPWVSIEPFSERYDPVGNRWFEVLNPAPFEGVATATHLLDDKVVVIGGRGQVIIPTTTVSVRMYQPAPPGHVPPWAWWPPLIQARAYHQATRLASGNVLVTGGQSCVNDGDGGLHCNDALNTVEYFDVGQRKWFQESSMHQFRAGHTATLLSDGTVLVAGDIWADADIWWDTAEIYSEDKSVRQEPKQEQWRSRDMSSTHRNIADSLGVRIGQ